MPREDYEKLKVLWPQEADTQRYTLVTQTETLVDHNLFITIRDNNTTAVKPYQKDIDMCHGLAMDILPLDGCPDSSWQRKKQLFWALLYSLFCAQLVPGKPREKRWPCWGKSPWAWCLPGSSGTASGSWRKST